MEKKLEIWIDGDCGLCRRSQDWCATRDHDQRLAFKDLRSEDNPPADRQSVLREIHVRRPDGSLATGYEGWLLILSQLPGWTRIAAVAAWSPVRRVGAAIYAIVAKRRHLVSRFLPNSKSP